MIGGEQLLHARLQGWQVRRVDIDLTGRLPTDWAGYDDGIVVLLVERWETAPRCDVRAVIGLPVMVLGDTLERVQPFAEACSEAGATRVTVATQEDAFIWPNDGTMRAWGR